MFMFAVPLCTFCTAGRVPWVRVRIVKGHGCSKTFCRLFAATIEISIVTRNCWAPLQWSSFITVLVVRMDITKIVASVTAQETVDHELEHGVCSRAQRLGFSPGDVRV